MALYENTIANAFAFGGEASKDIKCPDLHLVDHSLTQEKKHFSAKRQCFETYLPSPQSGMGNLPIWSPWAVRAGQSLGGRPGGPTLWRDRWRPGIPLQLCGRAGSIDSEPPDFLL